MIVNNPSKSTPGLRARRQIETRRRITEAAEATFREKGYAEATMRSIAARAGVATGTLFLYAPEKRSLLLMILNRDLEAATEDAFAALESSMPLLDQIMQIFSTRYDRLGRDPRFSLEALQQASFLVPAENLDPASEAGRYFARLDALRRRIAGLVGEGQRRGTVRADADPDDVARVVMAVYGQEVRMWLRLSQPAEVGVSALRRLLAVALTGCCSG